MEDQDLPSYTLQFENDSGGEPRKVEFEADNASAVLSALSEERDLRHVKVWEDGNLLGDVMRDRSGVWHLDD